MTVKRRKRTQSRSEGRPALIDSVVEDLGLTETLSEFTAGDLDVENLGTYERRVLLFLTKKDKSQAALARLLGVSRRTIQKDLHAIKRQVARNVDMDEVIGTLVLQAERLGALAFDRGDAATAWKIAKELVEVLNELGLIKASGKETGGQNMVEALSAGYERARTMLTQALDPRLTGEVHAVVAPGDEGPTIGARENGAEGP